MADRKDLEFNYSLIDRIFRLSLGELTKARLVALGRRRSMVSSAVPKYRATHNARAIPDQGS
jgi:hypothetical protein